MARLPRIFQKVFASTAPSSDIGVFGSLAAGSPTTGTNLTALQGGSQFLGGWRSAVIGNNSPALEDRNAVDYLTTSQLAYLFQQGVAEWDASTAYYIGSLASSGGQIYRSLTDNNTGNALTSTANWAPFTSMISDPYVPASSMANLGLQASVASNALTVSMTDSLGNSLSANNLGKVSFRNASLTNGLPVVRSISGLAPITVPSGSTLGHGGGYNSNIYVYLIDNAGTPELALSSVWWDEGTLVSTSAIGAGTNSRTMYSVTARSNVPCRLVGRIVSNQAVAGTWASAPVEVTIGKFDRAPLAFLAGQSKGIGSGAEAFFDSYSITSDLYNMVLGGVITVPKAGFWDFNVLANFGNISATFRAIGYRVNGGGSIRVNGNDGSANTATQLSVHLKLLLAAGDTVEFSGFQATGSGEGVVLTVSGNKTL